MIRAVLQDVHLLANGLERLPRFVVAVETPQRHVEPVGGRDQHVVVDLRHFHAFAICVEGCREIALHVMREAEVIPDVRLQRAPRNACGIRRAISLDFIGRAADEPRRAREISDRLIELADGDVSVAAMPVEPRSVGMRGDRAREGSDGLAESPKIREAAADPDRRVEAVGTPREVGARLIQIGFEPRPLLRRQLGGEKRLSRERYRFGVGLTSSRRRHRDNREQDHSLSHAGDDNASVGAAQARRFCTKPESVR